MNVAPNSLQGNKKLRGVSSQQSLFAIGIDNNPVRVQYIGQGHPTIKQLHDIWKDKIMPGSCLIHDDLTGYSAAFQDFKLSKEIIVKSTDKGRRGLMEKINAACSSFQWFLQKHRGITKDYFDEYTIWYETMANTHIKESRWYAAYYFGSLLPGI